MRYSLLALLVLIAGFATAYSQSSASNALERAKKISLLKATRSEIRNLFWDYEADRSDAPGFSDSFTKDDVTIDISYSAGGCSDDDQLWDVVEGVATKVEISTDEPLSVKEFGIDLSSLEKERAYSDESNFYVYYRKDKSLGIMMDGKNVRKITLLPSKNSKTPLCDSDDAKEFAAEKWFGDSDLKDRHRWHHDGPASVDALELNKNEFLSPTADKDVKVKVLASDPENDVLTYEYKVSGGRIIGSGPNVIWRLNGLLPGTYTITAGVDDGCGVCGKTSTQTVTIR